jgi:hypothetical protein
MENFIALQMYLGTLHPGWLNFFYDPNKWCKDGESAEQRINCI